MRVEVEAANWRTVNSARVDDCQLLGLSYACFRKAEIALLEANAVRLRRPFDQSRGGEWYNCNVAAVIEFVFRDHNYRTGTPGKIRPVDLSWRHGFRSRY